MKKLIYIVDDEPLQLHYLQTALARKDYLVQSFSDPHSMLKALEAHAPDAAVVDLVMPQMSGIDLIIEIRKISPRLPVIAVTAYPEIETAINAVRAGADDYLKKPFQTSELQLVVERLLATARLRDDLDSLVDKRHLEFSMDRFIGVSPQSENVRAQLKRCADARDASVLISGETGSGKSFAGRILHYAHADISPRLVELNCASASGSELEAELFGKVSTRDGGTVIHHPSLWDTARGGTMLLDYLSDLNVALQKRLHLFLTDTESLGGSFEIPCRIIVTTTLDPDSTEARDRFDPGMLEYLKTYHVRIPPLRERPEDILPLATWFIEHSESSSAVRVNGLTDAARDELVRYSWPGNIRELKSVIDRALVTTQTNLIDAQDLHIGAEPAKQGAWESLPPTTSLRDLEIEQIRRVLAYTKGDVTKAARILGISRKSLWERRKRYSLD